MSGGTIEYKCRRCGAVHDGVHSPGINMSVIELVVFGKVKSWPGVPATLLDIHSCPDGGTGIGDAIGGRPDPVEVTP